MDPIEFRSLRPSRRDLSADRHRQLEEATMTLIKSEPTQEPTDRPPRRSRLTRRTALIAAAIVVGTASVAGAAITLLGPDPEQAAQVVDDFSPAIGTIHPLGWRPDLQAEQTNCLLPGADAFVQEMLGGRPAYDFPLDEPLTEHHLAVACTEDDAYASENGYTAATATVCVSDTGRHPEPTVVIDGSACASVGRDLRPITDQDLAELNQMRAVEVAFLAVPSESECPTFIEARAWVNQQNSQFGTDLIVVELDEGSGVCYRGSVVWVNDEVLVTSVGPGPQSTS
jgi:hypothetical protein